MKFFTDKSVINPYLLIKVKDYIRLRDKGESFEKWEEVFIDPGVYELTKGPKYSWEGKLDMREFLDGLPADHYFSADKPSDMNPKYKRDFLRWSWDVANLYCNHPKYIVTVQHPIYCTFKNQIILDEIEFKSWFRKYNSMPIESGILGLGNICQINRLTTTLKNILTFAIKNSKHHRMHIYGLCLDAIPYTAKLAERNNIELSIDSTKWTRCTDEVRVELAKKFDIPKRRSCRGGERQDFFDEYLKLILRRGVVLENQGMLERVQY